MVELSDGNTSRSLNLVEKPVTMPLLQQPSTFEVTPLIDPETWIIFTASSYIKSGSGLGSLIEDPSGWKDQKVVRVKFKASNNEIEYEASFLALRRTLQIGARKFQLFTDSRFLANQFGVNTKLKKKE